MDKPMVLRDLEPMQKPEDVIELNAAIAAKACKVRELEQELLFAEEELNVLIDLRLMGQSPRSGKSVQIAGLELLLEQPKLTDEARQAISWEDELTA